MFDRESLFKEKYHRLAKKVGIELKKSDISSVTVKVK